MSNPLVATASSAGPPPWAGVWIAEDIDLIVSGVRGGSWIDGTIGGVSAGLDALALVSDPVGALLQYGIAWLIDHVRPLSEALDWLAGDPAQIAAHAQTWRNAAGRLRSEADELAHAASWELAEWSGAASEAYRAYATGKVRSLATLAVASDGMALITESAGLVIATVREMVRDAVATVVSRLIVYATELIATLGSAAPVVAEQVTTLCASWGAQIAKWLRGLIATLRKLADFTRRLGDRIRQLTHRERRPSGDPPPDPSGGTPGPTSRPPWTAGPGIEGEARGRDLLPPHPRHTLAGVRHGEIGEVNSVILRGNEASVRADIEQIALGNAVWQGRQSRYLINGRAYCVESTGRVFPDSGPGIAKLDRNEYAALKEIARHHGDVDAVGQFRHNPRFLQHPEAIAKAKAVYDGTWSG